MKLIVSILLFILTNSLFAESGFVRKVIGEVTIDGKVASVNDKVVHGQTIEAKGAKSLIVVKFESGSQFVLKDGALKIEEPKKDEQSFISLTKGIFASHFVKKGKGTQTVKTKYAAMGIRGTKFYVEEKEEYSYLCVCEGVVEISDGKKSELVSKNEDAKASANLSLEKTKANKMMVEMANDLVNEMN